MSNDLEHCELCLCLTKETQRRSRGHVRGHVEVQFVSCGVAIDWQAV